MTGLDLSSDDPRAWDVGFTPDDEPPLPPGPAEVACSPGYRHLNYAARRQVCTCGAVC